MPAMTLERSFFIFIILGQLVLGALFALRVPDWQAPDEPPHYNYIAQVAAGDWLPEIKSGDWDNDYLEQLKAEDFAPELLGNIASVEYENHQPPLYYWLGLPVYKLTNGSLQALRLYSLFLSLFTVMLAYAITRVLVPDQSLIALAVMAFVAFLPQQMHIMTSVNNDALAGLVSALTLWATLQYLAGDRIHESQLGVLVGIIFITKTTIYLMAGVVLVAVFMRWRREQATIGNLLLRFVYVGLPASIFAGIYWGRNLRVYGFPDFLGLQRHDEIVIGQLRTGDFIDRIGFGAYLEQGLKTTFHSFWGQFGWMEARLGDALPAVIWIMGIALMLAVIGLIIRVGMTRNPNPERRSLWVIPLLMVLLTVLQYCFYNLSFVQFQGRYLFVALIPIALLIVLGLDYWQSIMFRRIRFSEWPLPLLVLLLAPLDFYLIWRVIPGAVGG